MRSVRASQPKTSSRVDQKSAKGGSGWGFVAEHVLPLGFDRPGIILAAGFAGLRQGELLALRRGDVDLKAKVIHVRRKRQQLDSGEVIESAPSRRRVTRTVALPDPLVTALSDHVARFVPRGDDAYVFTSSDGYPIERNNFLNRVWLRATGAGGLSGLRFQSESGRPLCPVSRLPMSASERFVGVGRGALSRGWILPLQIRRSDVRTNGQLNSQIRRVPFSAVALISVLRLRRREPAPTSDRRLLHLCAAIRTSPEGRTLIAERESE